MEAHHEGPRGFGEKTTDWLAVPLCSNCHRNRHNGIVPKAYLAMAYEAQVKYLSSEIATLPLVSKDVFICGGCGSDAVKRKLGNAGFIPACSMCFKKYRLQSRFFACSSGLPIRENVSDDVVYFRWMHVLQLASACAKGVLK